MCFAPQIPITVDGATQVSAERAVCDLPPRTAAFIHRLIIDAAVVIVDHAIADLNVRAATCTKGDIVDTAARVLTNDTVVHQQTRTPSRGDIVDASAG